jgi:hypothetical protein
MPWVRFTKNYDYRPRNGVVTAYSKDLTLMVTNRCASEAIEAGAAEAVKKPPGLTTTKDGKTVGK